MDLTTDPANELTFKGPFDHVITTHLKLINLGDRKIIFKIKTTAPKYYCVRPNGGLLLPNSEINVQVMLQPFDDATEDRTKDKFMVQSAFIPADKENLVSSDEYNAQLWNDILPADLKNQKLKCVFIPSSPRLVEPVGSAPSSVNIPKTKTTETEVVENISESKELKRLHEEYRSLKAEVNNLLNENSMLKEQSMRARTAYSARPAMQQESEATNAGSASKENPPLTQMPIYLVVSVLILLLGVYIGKNVL